MASSNASSTSGRHRRRLCGHCNEELSYSAYRSHRALYYVESEGRWVVQDHQAEAADGAIVVEDTQMKQTGKHDHASLIVYQLTYQVPMCTWVTVCRR